MGEGQGGRSGRDSSSGQDTLNPSHFPGKRKHLSPLLCLPQATAPPWKAVGENQEQRTQVTPLPSFLKFKLLGIDCVIYGTESRNKTP